MGKRVVVTKNNGSRTVVQDGRIVGNIGAGTRVPSPSGFRAPTAPPDGAGVASASLDLEDTYEKFQSLLPEPEQAASADLSHARVERLRSKLWQGPPDQSSPDLPERIPLVVYGTLRQGEALDDGVLEGSPEVTDRVLPRDVAYIRGDMFQSTEGDWPLLDTRGSGWVTCEVVSMESDPDKGAWSKLGSDEIGWGYSVEYVPVYDQPGEDGEVVGVALACTWPWPQHRGAKIHGGDWLTRDGSTTQEQ